MGQHYIPKYYLKGFSDPLKPSNIWVYEKGSNRIFSSTVRRVANENKRWPDTVEEYFADKIEEPAKPVLDKIRNCRPMTGNDKKIFSDYMVIMLKRVPKNLERIKAGFPTVLEEVFAELNKEIFRSVEEYPSEKDAFQELLKELPRLKAKYENEFPVELWHDTLSLDSLPRVRAILPTMTWVFLTSEKKQPFLSSDNPLFFFEGLGMGRPESEITFPISSKTALWATWRRDLRESYVPGRNVAIKEINRRTASAATKYVYYSQEAQWVVNLINKKNIRLNRLT